MISIGMTVTQSLLIGMTTDIWSTNVNRCQSMNFYTVNLIRTILASIIQNGCRNMADANQTMMTKKKGSLRRALFFAILATSIMERIRNLYLEVNYE